MKFNQLRDFVAVAEAGSLRRAARALGLAQPAISRSIRELEHAVGAQLFVRGARGVQLTRIGKVFVVRAKGILEDVRRAGEEVNQLEGKAEGNLVIGLSIAGHMGILHRVLRHFNNRYPKVRLRIIEGLLPTLEASLLDATVDFYIGPVHTGRTSSDLNVIKLMDNERLVIARRNHPLDGAATLAELQDAHWLTTSVTYDASEELNAIFLKHGLRPPVLMAQCQSALSILTMLIGTDLLAMAPRQWVESPLMQDLIVPIRVKERFSAPPIMLVHRAGLGLTPAAEYFVSLVQRTPVPMAEPASR